MSDLDSPFPFDDEMVEEIDAAGTGGCTGCGCFGPTWATIVTAIVLVLAYALMKRHR